MRLLTHAYLANIILDELERTGGLKIPTVKGSYVKGSLREPLPDDDRGPSDGSELRFPFRGGDLAPPEDVREAVLGNKEYFRGGAAAGALLPDIAFSMSVIRPSDSGIWTEYLFDRLRTLQKGKERNEAYAFLLGLTVNHTASMFLRAYVNEYTEGWFDSFSGSRGRRQILIDEYVESAISFTIPESELKIAVPSGFLAVCFADGLAIEDRIKRIKDDRRSRRVLSAYNGNSLAQLRARSFRSSGTFGGERRESSDVLVYPEDIKNKLAETEAWISAWGKLAQDILNGGSAADMPADNAGFRDTNIRRMTEALYGPKRSSAKIAAEIEDIFWKKDDDKKEDDKKDDDKKGDDKRENDRKDGAERKKEEEEEKDDEEKETYDVCERIRRDLKEFGSEKRYPLGEEEKEFKAFSLALTASKFCLIGYKGLNKYLGKAEFREDRHEHSLRKIKLTVTAEEHPVDAFPDGRTLYGIEITAKNGAVAYNSLLSDGFAKNGEAVIDLPAPVPYGDIARFTLFSTSVFKRKIEGFEVKDEASGKIIAKMRTKAETSDRTETAKKTEEEKKAEEKKAEEKSELVIGKDISANVDGKFIEEILRTMKGAQTIDVPHRLTSWMYSIDGRDATERPVPSKRPWEYDEYVIYRSVVTKFRPTLLNNILTEEFDEPKEQKGKRQEGPDKQNDERPAKQTAVPKDPFDIRETQEGNMMDVAFEGAYVRMRDRILLKMKRTADSPDPGGLMSIITNEDLLNNLMIMDGPLKEVADRAEKIFRSFAEEIGMNEKMKEIADKRPEKKDDNDEKMKEGAYEELDKKDGMKEKMKEGTDKRPEKKDADDEKMKEGAYEELDKKDGMNEKMKESTDEGSEKGAKSGKSKYGRTGLSRDEQKKKDKTGLNKDKKSDGDDRSSADDDKEDETDDFGTDDRDDRERKEHKKDDLGADEDDEENKNDRYEDDDGFEQDDREKDEDKFSIDDDEDEKDEFSIDDDEDEKDEFSIDDDDGFGPDDDEEDDRLSKDRKRKDRMDL